MASATRYRKLPGRRRGLFRGASVWLGADHLLLVRSMRVREEYKRYQLRDVQAIVVARAARFHISTRAVGIAVFWLAAFLAVASRAPRMTTPLWMAAAALVIAWIVISWQFSCRCRIYTAVSRDELPSIYRTWTARRFLRQVEPRIVQVQGAVEGPWVDAISSRTLGPPRSAPPPPPPGIVPPSARRGPRTRGFASDLLIGALFADAIFDTVALHAGGNWVQSANAILALLEMASAIFVIVQHYRGVLRSAMQKLAIATLVAEGIFYYFRPVIVGMLAGARSAATRRPLVTMLSVDPWMRQADAVLCALLGFAGLVIVLMGRDDDDDRRNIISPSA
jgi:hypothetical protein